MSYGQYGRYGLYGHHSSKFVGHDHKARVMDAENSTQRRKDAKKGLQNFLENFFSISLYLCAFALNFLHLSLRPSALNSLAEKVIMANSSIPSISSINHDINPKPTALHKIQDICKVAINSFWMPQC